MKQGITLKVIPPFDSLNYLASKILLKDRGHISQPGRVHLGPGRKGFPLGELAWSQDLGPVEAKAVRHHRNAAHGHGKGRKYGVELAQDLGNPAERV